VKLHELADSIREHGVVEPILVRPKGDRFEIVFGARRFRASKLAEQTTIPAIVRVMEDVDALETTVIENLQRADVHPLEEAEGYEQLLEQKDRAYTVDDLAAKVGKSKAYVYARLKLLALCKEAREAFYGGKLTASTALLVARIPVPELQKKALEEILSGGEFDFSSGANEPMSYRDAQQHIVSRYTLRLADAPFDRADPELVSGAGVCTTCPKRSGAQPELFADVKSPDICTDPSCFDAKKTAAWKRTADEAKAKGLRVLSATEAKKVFSPTGETGGPNGRFAHVRHDAPYVELSARCLEDPKQRTYKQLLRKSVPEKVVARDPLSGKVREFVERDAAAKALKEAGVSLPKPPPAFDASANREKYEREEKLRRETQRRVAAAVVARLEKAEPDAKLWRLIAEALVDQYDTEDVIFRRFGEETDLDTVVAAIGKMKEPEARGFALELALVSTIYSGFSDASATAKELLAWAKVDAKALEKDARAAVKEQEAAAAKKPDASAEPSPAKKKGAKR
jgi:ParB/RepB/Spo0J family partition protein